MSDFSEGQLDNDLKQLGGEEESSKNFTKLLAVADKIKNNLKKAVKHAGAALC